MTDNEIIKALECCGNPLYYCNDRDCKTKTMGNALDLINRQKAEIERLQKAGEDAVNCFTRMESLYKIKCKELEVAKSEARKEIIEKIKSKFSHKGNSTKYGEFTWDDITSYELDSLLKEMEGEE